MGELHSFMVDWQNYLIQICNQCRSSLTLGPPKMLTGALLMVIYKKNIFDVMPDLDAEWPSKQNILRADTILAEPGP